MSFKKSVATLGVIAEFAAPGGALLDLASNTDGNQVPAPAEGVESNNTSSLLQGTGSLALQAVPVESGFNFSLVRQDEAPVLSPNSDSDPSAAPDQALKPSPPVFSPNWTGYIVQSKVPLTEVSADMKVPDVTCGKKASDALFWVGFDGYPSTTVEQDGVNVYCLPEIDGRRAKPVYDAWWEMWPYNFLQIMPMKISKGDEVAMSVDYSADNTYILSVSDLTKRENATDQSTCPATNDCLRTSAEWIIERPAYGSALGTVKKLARLAHWHKFKMDDLSVGSNGAAPVTLSSVANYEPIDMLGDKHLLAKVQNPLSPNNSFTAKWLRP